MAEKTIMKLYPNGDLETVGVQLQQIPQQLSNMFIRANTTSGYLSSTGTISPVTTDEEGVSEFIPVREGLYTFRATWNHSVSTNLSYYNIGYFDANRIFISRPYRLEEEGLDSVEETINIPSGVAYVRISVSFVTTTQVVFGQMKGVYSFGMDSVVVPQIIQQPSYRNYFIEKDTVEGYLLASNGQVNTANEDDRTSDFINVEGWESFTVRMRYANMTGAYGAYVGIYLYNAEKGYYNNVHEDYVGASTGDFVFTHKEAIPSEISFIRVCTNYYDAIGVTVQISVERGDTQDIGHVLAIEDIATWAKHTGSPISIFQEGIVIKGNLIQTNT